MPKKNESGSGKELTPRQLKKLEENLYRLAIDKYKFDEKTARLLAKQFAIP